MENLQELCVIIIKMVIVFMRDNVKSKEATVIMAKCPTCKVVTLHIKIGVVTQCFKCDQIYRIKGSDKNG